jgi:predicted nucleotidyltransferase
VLFGSMAKGIETDTSDCDLLLVLSSDSSISRSLYKKWDEEVLDKITLTMSKGREISPHFVRFTNNFEDIHSLWLEVAISGIVLWSHDLETELLLQKIRLAIANGRFVRKTTHGQPYWIRNEKDIIG